jgi:predicted acyl esterase
VGEERPRTSTERVVDQVVGRLLGLTRSSGDYAVAHERPIPMRDGVTLVADHYAPERPRGTILVRGPYDRGGPWALLQARLFAARGYHVVLQSCRGTYGSGGEFVPFVHEAADGADTVDRPGSKGDSRRWAPPTSASRSGHCCSIHRRS